MSRVREKVAWALATALGLLVVALLAGVIEGGSLDPAAPPSSTMKSLDDIPGSWGRKLASNDGAVGPDPPAGCDSTRFDCLEDWGDDLVLDRETGLVWERDATCCGPDTWDSVQHINCGSNRYDGRYGFRLPTWEELMSLVQDFVGTPTLPPGHPFIVYTDGSYWTASSSSDTTAWAYHFNGTKTFFEPRTNAHYAWCVRGGEGYVGVP